MYLVSACLTGINCRYDGKGSKNEFISDLVKQGKAIPVCPEQLGGLSTPRTPCEISICKNCRKKVITKNGQDFTEQFTEGAQKVLAIAKAAGIKKAILKSKSPSCGCGLIYDGTFTRKLIKGNGLTAQMLIDNGIEVHTEKELGDRVSHDE